MALQWLTLLMMFTLNHVSCVDFIVSCVSLSYCPLVPSAKNTYASGKGLTTPFDNAPAVFTIHAVDDRGQAIKEGGDFFDVNIHSPTGDALPSPTIVDNGNGTYTVTYVADQPGEYDMNITVAEHSIKDFPRKVKVREGTEGQVSSFGSFAFTVVAHDKRNQVKTFGGDPFEVVITGPKEASGVRAVDHGDGSYTASYTLSSGRYSVKVVLNGREVEGSPFIQKVGAGKHSKSAEHTTTARTNFEN